jgi:predicted RNase H-like HicB family nuclease
MNLPLKVALFQEHASRKSYWVAKCVDYGICSQGETEEAAKQSFKETLTKHVLISLHLGQEPFTAVCAEKRSASKSEPISTAKQMLGNLRICYGNLRAEETVSMA